MLEILSRDPLRRCGSRLFGAVQNRLRAPRVFTLNRECLIMSAVQKYDFAVAYRVYPRIGRAAVPIFHEDKFLLARVAFRSFVRSIQGFKTKLWILLDTCPPAYEEFFRANWPGDPPEFIHYQSRGNGGTFQDQISLLTAQNEAALCGVAEDDYFFLPECFQRLHELFHAHPEVDFATPYDHPEYYTAAHQEMSHEVLADPRLPIWRTVASTTCSFMARPQALRDCVRPFRSYEKPFLFNRGTDCSMWLAITRHRMFNPLRCAQWLKSAKYVSWSWLAAWGLCGKDILTQPKRNLWAPIPSLAMHLVSTYPPPGIDWNGLLQKAVDEEIASSPGK